MTKAINLTPYQWRCTCGAENTTNLGEIKPFDDAWTGCRACPRFWHVQLLDGRVRADEVTPDES